MKTNYTLILYAVAVIVVIIFLTAILRKIGIFKTKAKKEEISNIQEIREVEYFNPTYYKTVKAKNLPENLSLELAREIRKAVRGGGTNEDRLYSAFSRMYNKTNISQVAESYYLEYKSDMKTDILNDLNKKEVSSLMELIKSKPNLT